MQWYSPIHPRQEIWNICNNHYGVVVPNSSQPGCRNSASVNCYCSIDFKGATGDFMNWGSAPTFSNVQNCILGPNKRSASMQVPPSGPIFVSVCWLTGCRSGCSCVCFGIYWSKLLSLIHQHLCILPLFRISGTKQRIFSLIWLPLQVVVWPTSQHWAVKCKKGPGAGSGNSDNREEIGWSKKSKNFTFPITARRSEAQTSWWLFSIGLH